ncbi:hypothetical protein SRHO_G00003460 [Serrasalmus rhombeus]
MLHSAVTLCCLWSVVQPELGESGGLGVPSSALTDTAVQDGGSSVTPRGWAVQQSPRVAGVRNHSGLRERGRGHGCGYEYADLQGLPGSPWVGEGLVPSRAARAQAGEECARARMSEALSCLPLLANTSQLTCFPSFKCYRPAGRDITYKPSGSEHQH